MTSAAEAASTSTTRISRGAGGATRGTPRGTARRAACSMNLKTKRMATYRLDFIAEDVDITSAGMTGVNVEAIVKSSNLYQIIASIGVDNILNEIDEDAIRIFLGDRI